MTREHEDQRQLERRMLDIARRAGKLGRAFTRFLDPASLEAAVWAAGRERVELATHGGVEGAERLMACFYEGEAPEPWDWPMECLVFSWNPKYGSPGHRDILGALMGMGIAREHLGDIVMGADRAHLFVTGEMADYLLANLESAGRVRLKGARCQQLEQLPPPEGKLLHATVASPRLDALVAAGFQLSRAEAQALILQGRVRLNYREVLRTDAEVGEGDLVSVRGLGRFQLMEQRGPNRKGRNGVELFRYGG